MNFSSNWEGFGRPFSGVLYGGQLLNIVLIVLWVVILVDCARRNFTNDIEKVCWIIAMIVAPLIGSVAYLAVVKYSNPDGIMKKDGTLGSLFKKEEASTVPPEPKTAPPSPPHTPPPTPNTPMVAPPAPTNSPETPPPNHNV